MYSFPCVQTELLYRRGGKNHDTTDKSHFSFAGRKGKGKRKRIDPLPTWTAKSQPIERILSFKKKKNRTNSRISVIACRKPTRPQSNHSNGTQKRPTFRPHQQIEPDRTGKSTTDQESHLSPRLKPNSPEMPGCRTRTMWSMEQRRRGRGGLFVVIRLRGGRTRRRLLDVSVLVSWKPINFFVCSWNNEG